MSHNVPVAGMERVKVSIWDTGRGLDEKPWYEWVFVMWSQTNYGIEGVDEAGARHFINATAPYVLLIKVERVA